MIVEHDTETDYLRVVRDGFGGDTWFDAIKKADVEPLFDSDGTQVGLGLFDASAWSPAAWWTLPGRSDVPRDLFNAVAEWLGARERRGRCWRGVRAPPAHREGVMLHKATCPTCGATVRHIRLITGSTATVEPEPIEGRRCDMGEAGALVATEGGEWARIVGAGDVRGYVLHLCGGRS